MTTNQQRRPLIEYPVVKPFVDAAALGLAIGGPSAFSGNFWPGFVGGTSLSLLWYWGRGNVAPGKKRAQRGRNITVNTHKGQQNLRFEQVAPGYITRKSPWTVKGLFRKPSPPRIINQPPVSPQRPKTLDQFVFVSYDDAGNQQDLLSGDVRRFLFRAWNYQAKGKGLGRRFWDYRNQNIWPEWYPGPEWYEAMMRLLLAAEKGLGRQLIIVIQASPRRIKLRFPPRGECGTYEHIIYWYTENIKY